jgi:trans-aconitate methyltransferase
MIRFSAGYMEGAAEKPHIRRIKERSYELLEARPIGRILDVGCGPGVDTVALALKFPAAAQIVGVDIDPAMVAAADQNAR